MRNLIILTILTLALASCKKEEGYMFEAYHRIKSDHKRSCSDFFAYPEKDAVKALEFYKKERPWDPNMIEIDSTWVVYHCTVEEWNQKTL